ncbi:glycosyltransferase family 4 protein [Magnetococcales bacterium HHB-1]
MRVLTLTSLFPNSITPHHGIFVARRLQEMVASGGVEAHVIAPIPWFPSKHSLFGRYAEFAKVEKKGDHGGIPITYRRFPVIPKVGMSIAPLLMALSLWPLLKRYRKHFPFEVIDAHFFYPDGIAAVWLGERLNVPVVVTSRGTDLNLIPNHTLPRKMIQNAANKAHGLITVCQALKDVLIQLGIEEQKVVVLRNGVDNQVFYPLDQQQCRKQLNIDPQTKILLSVGHLITRKGHDLIIRALPQLDKNITLIIAGQGPEQATLEKLAKSLNVEDRVRFAGYLDEKALRQHYSAADILVLASSREGWANVLLESMACGTPVIASNVWGAPEVIQNPTAGYLLSERTPDAIAESCKKLLTSPPERQKTRQYASQFSWQESARGQKAQLQQAIDAHRLTTKT